MYEIIITISDIKRAVFTLSLVTLILVSILTVFADNNTTLNDSSNISVEPMSANAGVTVTPSTVNLGNVIPDGTEHSFPNVATVTVTDNRNRRYTTNLNVMASGNFVNTQTPSNIIPLANFKYENPYTATKTPFTTTSTLIDTWTTNRGNLRQTVNMNCYLTVPMYTSSGTYRVTITYRVS